jgi:phosphoglycerate dehydrogenase-like enzyme
MMSLTGSRAPNVDQGLHQTRHYRRDDLRGHSPAPAAEMALALLLRRRGGFPRGCRHASRPFPGRHPTRESASKGAPLGIVGLGRIGAYGTLRRGARHAGDRLEPEPHRRKAKEAGAERVDKDRLFSESDAITVHLVLGPRSRGLIGASDFARMKKGVIFVNTSRGPIVDEAALVAALRDGRIFAALDVYDTEPLPPDNPFRNLPNTVLTPHLGFTTVGAWACSMSTPSKTFSPSSTASRKTWPTRTPRSMHNHFAGAKDARLSLKF